MQKRHKDRALYFKELSVTTEKYLIPFIEQYKQIEPGMKVLEIGCGDGGNLLPFIQRGCLATGIDISETRIQEAKKTFSELNLPIELIHADMFTVELNEKFDFVLIHDVIEHITEKENFLRYILDRWVKEDTVLYIGFPAWQMPFGGHQQICNNKLVSHLPFIHLMPRSMYRLFLKTFKIQDRTIEELLDIKACATSIERMRKLSKMCDLGIIKEELYFINPHYEVKFGLTPRKLSGLVQKIPYIRNFFTSSCFYLLKTNPEV